MPNTLSQNLKQYELLDSKGKVVNTILLLDGDTSWQIPEGHTLKFVSDYSENLVLQQNLQLSQLEFLRRFTSQERIAAKTSADPIVEDFMYLLTLAQNIRLDDPDTIAGVNYLESVGILSEGRTQEILNPNYF